VLAGVAVGGVLPSLKNINLHAQMSWISYVLLFTVVLLISFSAQTPTQKKVIS
jgi:hypothetical protein